MPVTRFTPLELALIDEGRFLAKADEDLRKAEAHLVKYLAEHKGLAIKAKAEISLKIVMVCEETEPGNQMFSVKAISTTKLPNRPATVTLALPGEDEGNQPVLFVRRSGSTDDTPAQGVITTKDGRTVDTETGEVADAPKAAKKK